MWHYSYSRSWFYPWNLILIIYEEAVHKPGELYIFYQAAFDVNMSSSQPAWSIIGSCNSKCGRLSKAGRDIPAPHCMHSDIFILIDPWRIFWWQTNSLSDREYIKGVSFLARIFQEVVLVRGTGKARSSQPIDNLWWFILHTMLFGRSIVRSDMTL